MADDALAYLVEAFGHYSEAEMQAFLDSAVDGARAAIAARDDARALPVDLAAASLPRREPVEMPQAAWA